VFPIICLKKTFQITTFGNYGGEKWGEMETPDLKKERGKIK